MLPHHAIRVVIRVTTFYNLQCNNDARQVEKKMLLLLLALRHYLFTLTFLGPCPPSPLGVIASTILFSPSSMLPIIPCRIDIRFNIIVESSVYFKLT